MFRTSLLTTLALLASLVAPQALACTAYAYETREPTAVDELSPEDPGFQARAWIWGDRQTLREDGLILLPMDGGTLIEELDLLLPDCREERPTALLLEGLGREGWGRFAFIGLDITAGQSYSIDEVQDHFGASTGVDQPRPVVTAIEADGDLYRVHLAWRVRETGWRLSELENEAGWLAPPVSSWSIHMMPSGEDSPLRWWYSWVADSEDDAVAGHSRNHTAVIELDRERFEGRRVHFAVSANWGGSGDPEVDAVPSTYLGERSEMVQISDQPGPSILVDVDILRFLPSMVLRLEVQDEPRGIRYRIRLTAPGTDEFRERVLRGTGESSYTLRFGPLLGAEDELLTVEAINRRGEVLDSLYLPFY